MESQIIKFLKGQGNDDEGRSIYDIHNFNFIELEMTHDYIQWIFPIDKPSLFNKNAPVLTEEDIKLIKEDTVFINNNIRKSYHVFRYFLVRNNHWVKLNNHNHLRITRILRCLFLSGLYVEYKDFFEYVESIYFMYSDRISRETYEIWKSTDKENFK